MKDPIADALDVIPLSETKGEIVPVEPTNDTAESVKQDFEFARGQMVSAIDKGREALDHMLEIAQQSQHPRAFEVVATLVKTLADANKDLLELSKRKADLTGETASPTTVNNNLFVGSTADLQRLIKKQQNGEN